MTAPTITRPRRETVGSARTPATPARRETGS